MMKGDRGNLANPAVAFRDLIRGEARKISRLQDQISMGVVTGVGDGVDVEVQIDGFGAGSLTTLWCVAGSQPAVDQRVVLAALTEGQKWFVIALASAGLGASGQKVYFTASGAFVKADYPGLRAVRVQLQGGGGAGGGRRASPNGGRGGGGAGGGYAEKFILASALAASETVTIGNGGVGAYDTNGTAGGDSDFGVLVSGIGGGGGARTGGLNITVAGGSAGGGAGEDLEILGQSGQDGRWDGTYGTLNESDGGFGGGSHLGAGGYASPLGATGSGRTGFPYGGGGAGALGQHASTGGGGAGGKGIIIVELHF